MPLLRPPHLLVCKVCLNHQKTHTDVINYARKIFDEIFHTTTTSTINQTTKFIRKTRVHHFSPSLQESLVLSSFDYQCDTLLQLV